jgi:tRNA dimethylallyltransferase
MQVYRGMDIGTAKVPVADRRGVPHHLLDVWDVSKAANVAEYQRLARAVIPDIHGRGRLPILAGGSGLYVRAVLDQLDFPGYDPEVRARLSAELEDIGAAALHQCLADLDPSAAAAILPGNGRRIVRALEVIEITGQPFTAQLPEPRAHYRHLTLGLTRPRADLDAAIADRVDRMWAQGFVAEVAGLADLPGSPTASLALGYRQILAYLAGEMTEEQARDGTVRATRRFARRQESWFRRDPAVVWLAADDEELVGRAQHTVATSLAV